MILKWRDYVQDATTTCAAQFAILLESYGIYGMDPTDMFSRICHRYCGYARTINCRNTSYFESIWGMNNFSDMFANKEAKWFIPLVEKRLPKEVMPLLTDKVVREILSWVGRKYSYWLYSQE
jgi:hypothetical protein